MRTRSITDEIVERACAFVDRRGGAGIRRGGRSRGSAQKRKEPLYVLTGYSAVNNFLTAAGGGEAGDAAGFGVAILGVVERLAAGDQIVARRRTVAPVTGWQHAYTAASKTVSFQPANGAGARVTGSSLTLTASDVGRIVLLLGAQTGADNRALTALGRDLRSYAACVGYSPDTTSQMLLGAAGADVAIAPFAMATYRGVLTDSQIAALYDAARVLGDLPASGIPGGPAWTHRASLRDELRGQTVVSGQTAPAQLTDTITRAAADALARQGSPTVVAIDTSRDGRRALGVLSTGTTASYLQTSGTAFRGSLDKFWFSYWWTPTAASTSAQRQLLTHTGTLSGLILYTDAGANGALGLWNLKSNSAPLGTYARSAADVGQPMLVTVSYDNGAWSGYVNGGLWATGNAAYAVSSGPVRIFTNAGFSAPAEHASWWGLAGSDSHAITGAEALQHYQDVTRTGRMQGIAGKTEHVIDPTTDMLAAGETVPAQILDRIGTDHLTRVGGLRVTTTPANGIADFSSAHWIQSAGVTLPGAAGGFYAECLGYYVAGASAEDWFSCAAFAATAGWRLGSWNGYANVQAGDGAAAKGAVGSALMSPGLNHLALVYDGSVLKQFLNGTLYNTTTTFTYAVSTLAASFGINRPSAPANITAKSAPLGGAYGLIAPSDAQIAAAASAALSAGRIVGVPGHSQRYDLVQDVIDAGGKVPAIWRERVANTNTMTTVGAPLQVAQRTERTWSYETSPIYYGATAFTDADRYVFDGGFPGDAASWWGLLWYLVTSQSVPSATRGLLACNTATSGWDVRTTLTNTTIAMGFADGAGSYTTVGTSAIAAADVGKVQAFGFGWNAPVGQPQTFAKRAAIAAAARTGYTPSAGGTPLVLGGFSAAGNAATAGISILGFALGFGAPALAEWQAAFDAGLALERVIGIANRTSTLVDLTLDAKANGGALAALAQDRAGGGRAMTRAGSPTITAHHARSFGW